jgi:hypothetical protein
MGFDNDLLDDVRFMHADVVGVNYNNDDGESRQEIISRCVPFEPITLDHQEDNPYDKNAIAVLRDNGEQIGFLEKHLAKEFIGKTKRGYLFTSYTKTITGQGKNRGVTLVIFIIEPDCSIEKAKLFIQHSLKRMAEKEGVELENTESGGSYGANTDEPPISLCGCLSTVLVFIIVVTIVKGCM